MDVKLKRFAFSIILVLTFTVPAQANTQSGVSCKKLGTRIIKNDKTYICKKVKGKFVYKKLILNEKAPYQPWSSPMNSSQIYSEARANFRIWVESNGKNDEKLKVTLGPGITESDIDYILLNMKLASKSFLNNASQTPHVYFSVGDNWVLNQLKIDYPIHSAFNRPNVCYPPNPTAGCAWPNYELMFFVAQDVSDWTNQKRGIINSGAHEFFHVVQDILMRNNRGVSPGQIVSTIPAWFFEGSATFIGTAFTDLSEIYLWKDIRSDEIGIYEIGRGKNEPLESFQLNLLDRPQPEAQSHRPYGIGMLACEFIVASVGMDKYLAIYKELGSGKNFNDAFEVATGISLAEFYKKFDDSRTSIGFYPVKN